MKKETKARLLVLKDYLQKWDWSLAPLFMLSEEDAEVIMDLITEREERARKNHEKYERKRA